MEENKKCKHCGSEIDKNAKICPVCKKRQKMAWWQIALIVVGVLLLLMIITPSGNSNNTVNPASETNPINENKQSTSNSTTNQNNVYRLGETWEVEGQWKLTINSITETEDRNQFSEKNPAQVFIIDYSYENLGYEDEFMDGLFFSITNGTIVDASGEMGESYPLTVTNYPQETPVGAKCSNAQDCICVYNNSDKIIITITKYDSNSKKQKATFELDV